MQTTLTILHVLVSIFMILVILLQAGRGGGLSGLAGGSSSVFGGRGSQTFLGKVTTVSAAVFMITSLTLAYLSSRDESILRNLPAEAPADAAPAIELPPGGEEEPPVEREPVPGQQP